MQNNFVLCEADKLNIEDQLDVFYSSIVNRLLPSFSELEKEADNIEKESLIKSSKYFNPEIMDEACVVEDAYFDGVNHYLIQNQMKQSFLNVSTLWLYHLFEQQLNNISLKIIENFDYTKIKKSREQIENCLIEKGLVDNVHWQKIDKDLRLVANTLKHAEGRSKNDLEKIRPDLFASSSASTVKVAIPLFENEICVSKLDFNKYHEAIVGFWGDYFNNIPVTQPHKSPNHNKR